MTQPPSRTGRVRAALSGPRLLAGLIALLIVPGTLGVAALTSETPAPAPAVTAEPHEPLPQVPDSVARAQLDRSAQVTRQARRLTTPALLNASDTGSTGVGTMPTLALAPRITPYTLAELRAMVPAAFTDLNSPDPADAGGAVLVGAHIDVPLGATLVFDGQTPNVRLASSPAGFATLISRGTVEVTGSADAAVAISSWDPRQGAPDTETADGRAFVLQIGGRMDVDHARFEFLGFGTGTSSGVAWRGAAGGTAAERIKAQGTVRSSVFAHNHFGAYTHEAQGMLREANTFADNTEYGFDPHDFSDDFLVVANTARGNGKHGFIFSRGCDRNTLRGNYSYDNAGHGFMIDDGRTAQTAGAESRIDASDDNLVIANVAYDNANSGVEIEGGTGNVIAETPCSATTSGSGSRTAPRPPSTTTPSPTATATGSTSSTVPGRSPSPATGSPGPGPRSTWPPRAAPRWGPTPSPTSPPHSWSTRSSPIRPVGSTRSPRTCGGTRCSCSGG